MLNEGQLHGTNLTGSPAEFSSQKNLLLSSLLKCLKKRFEDIDHGLLSAVHMADFKSWPTSVDSDPGMPVHVGS